MNRPMDKKKRRILIVSVLAIALGLVILRPQPPKIDVNKNSAKDEHLTFEKETIAQSGGEPPYTIDAQYPRLAGATDKTIEDKVNASIKATVDQEIHDFKTNLNQPIADLPGAKNTLTLRYDGAYLTNYIASIAIESSSYTIGAAHESTFVDTLTYDLRSGKLVQLSDLFLPGSDYLKVISDYSIKAVAQELQVQANDEDTMQQIREGAAPRKENFHNFIIAKEGLTIIFDRYQVAAGAAGTPKIVVPYALLEKDVNPAGLLAVRFADQ